MSKRPLLLSRVLTFALVAAPLVASAHPGHDGDHDVTWDFSHLAEHPFATFSCFAVILGAAWLVRLAIRRAGEENETPTDSSRD